MTCIRPGHPVVFVRTHRFSTTMAGHRGLQFLPGCTSSEVANTGFNDDLDVTAFQGMFFAMQTRDEPLEIETMEIDVRVDFATDLRIQVYTYKGLYNLQINKPESWTLVADVEAVPKPDGSGVILPASAFDTVFLQRDEKRSFYFYMNGPWIDNRVNALNKVGERDFLGLHFATFAGSGTDGTKFPSAVAIEVAPQFAGILHYKVSDSCADEIATTTVEYEFLLQGVPTEQLLNDASISVLEVIDDHLRNDPVLKEMRITHSLARAESARTIPVGYDGM